MCYRLIEIIIKCWKKSNYQYKKKYFKDFSYPCPTSCFNRALKVKVVIQSCFCDDELEFMTSLIPEMVGQDLDMIFMKEAWWRFH